MPVSLELLGKALELARGEPVYIMAAGYGIEDAARKLSRYGAASIHIYDSPELKYFEARRYSICLCDFITRLKPSALLIGATGPGRSLAPRVAAAFRTGLTADCTSLEMEKGLLIQTRPAFGGNIMARIITKYRRPQICTVRYRVFDAPPSTGAKKNEIIYMEIPDIHNTGVRILFAEHKPPSEDISEAERIVAVGRGAADEKGLALCKELARLLGAQMACSRPLAEAGAFEQRRQIGLSGRIVKPKLLIAAGVSGAVQFTSAMSGAEMIIAINPDSSAPIFKIAHHCYIGSAHEILPALLRRMEETAAARDTTL
jgi:electron transfer flavoprotein alpha subunit